MYDESGRYPLAVSSQIRSIKYCLRLLKLNQDRLPFGAYRCSQNLAERGKVSWSGRVKELLLKQGFGEVWYNQGVGDEKKFLRTFSQRLKDCFRQSWHDKLESSDRFLEYKLMKHNFGMEEYICSMRGHLRDALLRFRAGVSWIKAGMAEWLAFMRVSYSDCILTSCIGLPQDRWRGGGEGAATRRGRGGEVRAYMS